MRATAGVPGHRRAREFEAFVAGAAGRLLHAATLLTGGGPDDNPRARRLLTLALAHTYACWDRLRGEDPYDRARQHLAAALRTRRLAPVRRAAPRPARTPAARWRRLTPQERLILVLRLYEGVAEEQAAALLGLPDGTRPRDLRPGDGHAAAPAARARPPAVARAEGGGRRETPAPTREAGRPAGCMEADAAVRGAARICTRTSYAVAAAHAAPRGRGPAAAVAAAVRRDRGVRRAGRLTGAARGWSRRRRRLHR